MKYIITILALTTLLMGCTKGKGQSETKVYHLSFSDHVPKAKATVKTKKLPVKKQQNKSLSLI